MGARPHTGSDWRRAAHSLPEQELSALPSWKDERTDALRRTLQLALDLERPNMVAAALHHGAPVKEVNLLHLYRKVSEPEQVGGWHSNSRVLPSHLAAAAALAAVMLWAT